jgi:hypothetical protein
MPAPIPPEDCLVSPNSTQGYALKAMGMRHALPVLQLSRPQGDIAALRARRQPVPAVNLGVCTAHVQLSVKVPASENKEPPSTTLTIDDCAWRRRVRRSSRRLCPVTEVHFRARARAQPHPGRKLHKQSCSHVNGQRYALPATYTRARHCIWRLHSPSPAHCASALQRNGHPPSTTLTIDDCACRQRVRRSSRKLCMVTEVHFRARMRAQPCPGRALHKRSCSHVNGRRYALPSTLSSARHCHSHCMKAISLLHALVKRVVLVHSRPNHGSASYSTKNHLLD